MKRRTVLRLSGTACLLGVAGCVADGNGNDESSDGTPATADNGDSSTGDNENSDDSGTEGDNNEATETADGTDEQQNDDSASLNPKATVEAFYKAIGEGDKAAANELLHPDSKLDPITDEVIERYSKNPLTLENAELTKRDDGVANVRVTVTQGSETAQTILVLRQTDNGWKLWNGKETEKQNEKQLPNVEFEIEVQDGALEITHDTGDDVAPDNLYIRGDGLTQSGSWNELDGEVSSEGMVTAGDELRIGVTGNFKLSIVYDDGEVSAVLATKQIQTGEKTGIDAYLSDAVGYDGTIEDHTGKSTVTVKVGVGDNGFGFDPAAIEVSPGTTVVWEWTGEGGTHNVFAENGAFESELVSEEGYTFEHTFEKSGEFRYNCLPHKAIGMKGAVVVTESD